MHIKCKYRRAVCTHTWCFSCYYMNLQSCMCNVDLDENMFVLIEITLVSCRVATGQGKVREIRGQGKVGNLRIYQGNLKFC